MTSSLNGAVAPTRSAGRVEGEEVLRVEGLEVHFPLRKGVLIQRQVGTIKAVDGVSFALRRGDTLGLVGESGCGKSTTGLAILRMLEPTAGRIVFEGRDITHVGARRDAADPAAHADGLPGPLRLAEPAHDGARHRRRAAGGALGWPAMRAHTPSASPS